MSSNPGPSCGTTAWFETKMNINPNESISQKGPDAPSQQFTNSWPYWQNFYESNRQVSGILRKTIPNWGTISNQTDAECSYPSCSSNNGVKPYGKSYDCGDICIITPGTSVNNQGTIVGSVTIENTSRCTFEGDDDSRISRFGEFEYMDYMGSKNCSNFSINSEEYANCNNSSSVCVTDDSGDNCLNCSDLETKNKTCCISPNIGELAESLGQTLYTDKNKDIIEYTGDYVSYICQESCPQGSLDLNKLVNTCDGGNCDSRDNKESCEECIFCVWLDDEVANATDGGTGGRCVSECPSSPPEGWGIAEPLPEPTEEPSGSPEPSAPGSEEEESQPPDTSGFITGLSQQASIGVVVGAGVGGLVLLGLFIWLIIWVLGKSPLPPLASVVPTATEIQSSLGMVPLAISFTEAGVPIQRPPRPPRPPKYPTPST